MIKVSLIVTIYNKEKYLEACLESIINQTEFINNFSEYEVILLNNGSTDRSEQIARQYYKKYKNILLIDQQDLGIGIGWNTALKIARGEYIYFINADDTLKPNLLSSIYNKAHNNNLDALIFSTLVTKNGKKEIFPKKLIDDKRVFSGKDFIKEQTKKYGSTIISVLWLMILKRSFLEEINFKFRYKLASVEAFSVFEILFKANKVMIIPDALYEYSVKKDSSLSDTGSLYNFEEDKLGMKWMFEVIESDTAYNKNDIELNKGIKSLLKWWYNGNVGLAIKEKSNEKKFIEVIEYYIRKYLNTFGNIMDKQEKLELIRGVILYCRGKLRNISSFIECFECDVKRVLLEWLELENEMEKDIIKQIPFEDCTKTIGIYGLGSHTDNLIKFYNKNINDIRAKILFFDSYKGYEKEMFHNQEITNINEINKCKLDCLVISSCTFEEEMYKTVENILEKKIKIFRFYEKNKFMLFV